MRAFDVSTSTVLAGQLVVEGDELPPTLAPIARCPTSVWME